jgi:uncharacterized protein GlcG (DUF336 family)/catechol 2,3-dioxygenase-like lactoylglutathione lyase family enzyme
MDLLAHAKAIGDRIEAQSALAGTPVAISVVDVHGNVVLKRRMNRAPVYAIELSERKAYTSALVGVRTGDLSPLVQPGQPLFALMGLAGGRFCSMGGGAPLLIDGRIIAGVGVSGGTVEQDVDILEAALNGPDPEVASTMKLEVIVIPVADAERAKRFYGALGWRLDLDYAVHDYRVIQFTPPGSECSVIFGDNVTSASAGSVKGLHLIVSDIEATRADLLERDVAVSAPFHDATGVFHHAALEDVIAGLNRQRKSYASFASFSDPDGNTWTLQEVTTRLTGHIEDGEESFTPEITDFIRRAAAKARLDAQRQERRQQFDAALAR